jgi:hypothetical protein
VLDRVAGVVIPDLALALDEQAQRPLYLLDVPEPIATRFRQAALSDRPEYNDDDEFSLQDLADAFVLNYDKSTVQFRGGFLVSDRIPPVDQYLNLLKCVWLHRRIKRSSALLNSSPDSHWPSYARELEDVRRKCSPVESTYGVT